MRSPDRKGTVPSAGTGKGGWGGGGRFGATLLRSKAARRTLACVTRKHRHATHQPTN